MEEKNKKELIELVKSLQKEKQDLEKAYIELDLECRDLRTENEELKSPKFASWKLKFFRLKEEFDKELAEHEEFAKKANAEIERLAEERDKYQEKWQTSYMNELNLQKQVDELTKQREVGREKLKNEIANKIFMSAFHGAIQCGKMSIAIAEIEAEKYIEFAWEMVQQAVKDTAKEILQEIWEEEFEIDVDIDEKSKADVMKVGEAVLTEIHNKIKEIAKRKGVEVE